MRWPNITDHNEPRVNDRFAFLLHFTMSQYATPQKKTPIDQFTHLYRLRFIEHLIAEQMMHIQLATCHCLSKT